MAEPQLPGRQRLRGGAAGRSAAEGRRAPPRECGARARARDRAAARGLEADPLRRRAQGGHGGLRTAPLRLPRFPAPEAARDRGALHRHEQLRAGVRLLLAQRARSGAARAARRVFAFRDRPRWHDLPARADLDHVPPHGRAELDRRRDRARRPERRRGDGQPAPAGGVAASHPLPPGPLWDRHAQRDRPQREPLEPVPPGARGAAAQPDPRGLSACGDGRLPATA